MCDQPNNNLHKFEGTLVWDGLGIGQHTREALNLDQLLLRVSVYYMHCACAGYCVYIRMYYILKQAFHIIFITNSGSITLYS